jgi:hypothetical protein
MTENLADKKALRKEADEIWVDFRPDAEKLGLHNAIISANEFKPSFLVQNGKGYNFVFEQDSAGSWRCLDDK